MRSTCLLLLNILLILSWFAGISPAYEVELEYFNSVGLKDENFITLKDGSAIQLIFTPDASIDPPDPSTGEPAGDDVLWEQSSIGTGMEDPDTGQFDDSYYYDSAEQPAYVYIRFFNAPRLEAVTYYGISRLHRLSDIFRKDIWDATAGGLSLWTEYPITVLSNPGARAGGDYDGDGTSDCGIFRQSSGLWAIRAVSRFYFGAEADIPVPGDYDGDGTDEGAVFRPSSGLWAARGVTRFYFGLSSDLPCPADYDGDGSVDFGIFRETSGLWAIRNISRFYFGSAGDRPEPGDYDGDGIRDGAVFRKSSGYWALRDITGFYFGCRGDGAAPGDYDGDGTWETGIFRYSCGLWAVRGLTRSYFGSISDQPLPADYDGDGADGIAIFRDSTGLWAVRGISRLYYGAASDIPAVR